MYPLLKIHHSLIIEVYAFFVGVALFVAYSMGKSANKKSGVFKNFHLHFFIFLFFTFMGAKLLFLFTQNLLPISELMILPSFWTGGGMVFYGGLLGGALYLAVYCYYYKLNYTTLGAFIPSLMLAHAIGRVGCLFAGCCYGAVCDLPWAITLHNQARHPVPIYEAIGLLLGALWLLHKKFSYKSMFTFYCIYYSILRFMLEFLRGDSIRGVYYGLATSQWISIIIFILGIMMLRDGRNSSKSV